MIHNNILEIIGNTPIVRLNRISMDCRANLYAKLEYFNPGGSIKDRLGEWLVIDAEKRGVLKPGGTIVEGTSGNTGFGLALAAAIKGYRCIFVLPDKMSEEKIKNLRAFGAKVVVTPTAVAPDDPRSYYSVSRRLAKETPNAFFVDQYNNLANRDCHYKTTGPEILRQMPDIDVFVAGIGTGGTICGVGRYLKEQKPEIETVAVDPVGSIVYDRFKTGKEVAAKTYKIEGIGEDFIPKNYDFDVISDMVQVDDKESFLMTRELLNKEGIYSGVSSGSAVVGALRWVNKQGDRLKNKNVLIVLPDSGNRYLSKVYDDEWMQEAGFLERSLGTVDDLLHANQIKPDKLITVDQGEKVSEVITLLSDKGISQIPVKASGENGLSQIVGIVTESAILAALHHGTVKKSDSVETLIDSSIEFVKRTDPVEKVSKILTSGKIPIVVGSENAEILGIVTKIDLLTYIGSRT